MVTRPMAHRQRMRSAPSLVAREMVSVLRGLPPESRLRALALAKRMIVADLSRDQRMKVPPPKSVSKTLLEQLRLWMDRKPLGTLRVVLKSPGYQFGTIAILSWRIDGTVEYASEFFGTGDKDAWHTLCRETLEPAGFPTVSFSEFRRISNGNAREGSGGRL